MSKPIELHRFYKSKAWKLARNIKINEAQGKCEQCNTYELDVKYKDNSFILALLIGIDTIVHNNRYKG